MAPRWVFPIVAALTLAMPVSADAATVQITMENLKTVTLVLKKAGLIDYYCRFIRT
jgi:hypothetical protein